MQKIGGCILEAYNFGSKLILCHIRVKPRLVLYWHSSSSNNDGQHLTNHWMQEEDWAKFDSRLEQFLEKHDDSFGKDHKEEETFHLNALVVVRIRKSHISIKTAKQCLHDFNLGSCGKSLVLELEIEYNEDDKWWNADRSDLSVLNTEYNANLDEYHPQSDINAANISNETVPYTPSPKINTSAQSSNFEDHEAYSPQPIMIEDSQTKVPKYSPSSINKNCQNISAVTPKRACDEVKNEYVGESSLRKTRQNHSGENLESEDLRNKDNRSAQSRQNSAAKDIKIKNRNVQDEKENNTKLVDDDYINLASSQESIKEIETKSNKTPQKEVTKYKYSHAEDDNVAKTENNDASNDAELNLCKEKSKDKRTPKKKRQNVTPNMNDNKIALTRKPSTSQAYDSPTILPQSGEEDEEAKPEKRPRKEVNYKDCSSDEIRRSARSFQRPKRFIADNHINNDKVLKQKKRYEDIFGADDHNAANSNNNADAVVQTPNAKSQQKLSTNNEKSNKKKRKRERAETNNDCAQEKQTINKWLEKKERNTTPAKMSGSRAAADDRNEKKLISKHKEPKSSTSESEELKIVYPTAEELEARRIKETAEIEYNMKLKEALKELIGPPPKKVETLTLNNVSTKDILNSIEIHKPILDEIFHKLKRKLTVHGHNGVNHILVIQLVDEKKQFQMLRKLGEIYEKQESLLTDTSLFTNALLPEWIILLFMEKYKFTRSEAIEQIKAQEDYELHLNAQSQ